MHPRSLSDRFPTIPAAPAPSRPCETSCWPAAGLALLVLLAAGLSACGGGGGEEEPAAPAPAAAPLPPEALVLAPAPAPGPVPAPANPDLVTVATPASYAAGSVERGAWNVWMTERATCGFGVLQQDSRLDAASAAHASYLSAYSVALGRLQVGHDEDAARPGFTGRNGLERATAQGLSTRPVAIDEILSGEALSRSPGTADRLLLNEARGATAMRALLGTVYHLTGAVFPGRVGGVGASRAASAELEVFEFGSLSAFTGDLPQRLGSRAVASYPCQGAQHVRADFQPATESPNPFPDVTDRALRYGTPVYFRADEGSTLAVSSASITRQSDGAALAFRSLTMGNDPAGQLGRHEFFMVPIAPLAVGVGYTVTVTGTVDGSAFTKSFTFQPAP